MNIRKFVAVAAAAAAMTALTLTACAPADERENWDGDAPDTEITEGELLPPVTEEETAPPVEEITPAEPDPEPVPEPEPEPEPETVKYILVTGDGVNIRTGAGTAYTSLGAAEKSTLYVYEGETSGWYKTYYKNKTAYISSKYCSLKEFTASENALIESVIYEGVKLLGTPYVYGAVRLHNGKGTLLSGFTKSAFDCSSLMQYMFYYGADYLLDVNTRTQIYQGKTVTRANLVRGDLMFFTNETRKNYTGIERVGHVALYFGDNYILHTASDYAKIEKISSTRWSYFIQGQRIL